MNLNEIKIHMKICCPCFPQLIDMFSYLQRQWDATKDWNMLHHLRTAISFVFSIMQEHSILSWVLSECPTLSRMNYTEGWMRPLEKRSMSSCPRLRRSQLLTR
uniref:Uncharacterized protein n=1 Tax=Opuntia streptacantha TaxID=393608 RepID=A0A7C9FQA0_OPUST